MKKAITVATFLGIMILSCDNSTNSDANQINSSSQIESQLIGSWHGYRSRVDDFDTTLTSFTADHKNPFTYILCLRDRYYQTNVINSTWAISNDTLIRTIESYKESRDSGKTWKDMSLTERVMKHKIYFANDSLFMLTKNENSQLIDTFALARVR